jgi:hypothetical protein
VSTHYFVRTISVGGISFATLNVDGYVSRTTLFYFRGENAMRRCSGTVWAALVCAIVVLRPGRLCSAGSVGAIVPAYFYPGSGGPGGVGDGWAAMTSAAGQIPITAVLNPNSGPLPGPADPNYTAAMTNLESAGGKVVAYVFTNDGNTPISTVEGQISTYLSQYGSLIDGFYLDGMLVTPGTLSYYQSVDGFIKGLSASYKVIGNPRQPYLNGVGASDYLSTADNFDLFEGPDTAPMGNPGFNNYPYGQSWFMNYSSSRFSNTIYNVPTVSAMLADVSRAAQLNAGDVYATDASLPNPYDALPSYWDQEVAAIASLPEPGAVGMLAVLMGGLAGRRRALGRRC